MMGAGGWRGRLDGRGDRVGLGDSRGMPFLVGGVGEVGDVVGGGADSRGMVESVRETARRSSMYSDFDSIWNGGCGGRMARGGWLFLSIFVQWEIANRCNAQTTTVVIYHNPRWRTTQNDKRQSTSRAFQARDTCGTYAHSAHMRIT